MARRLVQRDRVRIEPLREQRVDLQPAQVPDLNTQGAAVLGCDAVVTAVQLESQPVALHAGFRLLSALGGPAEPQQGREAFADGGGVATGAQFGDDGGGLRVAATPAEIAQPRVDGGQSPAFPILGGDRANQVVGVGDGVELVLALEPKRQRLEVPPQARRAGAVVTFGHERAKPHENVRRGDAIDRSDQVDEGLRRPHVRPTLSAYALVHRRAGAAQVPAVYWNGGMVTSHTGSRAFRDRRPARRSETSPLESPRRLV